MVAVVREDVDRHVRDEFCDLAVGEARGADLLDRVVRYIAAVDDDGLREDQAGFTLGIEARA